MPNNDIEVFEHLTADKDSAVEIDFLSYAMFAFRKSEWIEHFKKKNDGKLPTQAQIDEWIGQITDFDFEQLRKEAAEFFHSSAEEHLREYIEDQKKEAVDRSIISEVKSIASRVKEFTAPWKHLGIALLMAIVAPVILGGIFFLFAVFDKSFPIHVTF